MPTTTETTTIALFGAGGNMGTRLTNALKTRPEYTLRYIETGEPGIARLKNAGLEITEAADALADADVVILAIPDALIGTVAPRIVPNLKSGAIVITLDPAAPYAGKLPEREDISYFVTHPAHPPVYNDETDMAARRDFFGSGLAKQSIVNALMQGPESDYARGEEVARAMWGPVLRSHRVTVAQMAMLEPALSETVACTCAVIMREAMDEAISRGVPDEAARDFLMGHINIALAVAFDEIEWDFSAGAKQAIDDAKRDIFQPDWKKVFDEDRIRGSIRNITG